MRFAGLGAGAVLAVCLGAVVLAMTGGPQAPFTQWAVPQAQAGSQSGHPAQDAAAQTRGPGARGDSTPNPAGAGGTRRPSPSTGTSPGSLSASPSAGPAAGPSQTPTNRAGRTPPGQTRSPNPRKSTGVP
jgi:hypothetical protein